MRMRRSTLAHIQERTAPNGQCLKWQGAISASTGYGKVRFKGVVMDTHRASWIAAHGPIAPGLLVMHSCDNRWCIRLEHLSLGSHSDNMRDAALKGRLPENFLHGEQSSKAKLTLAQVLEILTRLAAGETGKSIAKDYAVHQTAISKIKHGVSWSRALIASEPAA